jgi:hypothetical protein
LVNLPALGGNLQFGQFGTGYSSTRKNWKVLVAEPVT